MNRLLALAFVLGILGACQSRGPGQEALSFSQMQSLNPGISGEWILSEYPMARETRRRPDGSIESIGYWVVDPEGTSRPLMLRMDAQGVMQSKQYGGPIIRPPPER